VNERINEEIGALLDGRLESGPRTELLARLAASDEDFDVFADTAAVLREAEEGETAANEPIPITAREPERPAEVIVADTTAVLPEAAEGETAANEPVPVAAGEPEQPAGVIPLRPRRVSVWQRPGVRWLAAAAVVAAIALPPVLQSRANSDAWRDPAHLVALSPGARLPQQLEYGWGQTRGGSGVPAENNGLVSVMGAYQADLEIAARSNDFAQVSLLAERTALALEKVTAAGPVAAQYHAIAKAADQSDPNLRSSIAAAREELATFFGGDVMGDYLALGSWTEAARRAAERGDAEFFRRRESRNALKTAAALADLSDEGKMAVTHLRAVQEQGKVKDWSSLRGNLDTLQNALAR